MANKVLRTRIAQKFATAAQWETSTLVLLKGELAIDEQNRIKIGDGIKKWSELPFAVDPASTPAITFPDVLPDPTNAKAGALVMTPDGTLWALGGEEGSRQWVDLTNKADVEGLQSSIDTLQENIDAVQEDVDAKDEALQSAVVALTNSDKALEAAVVSLRTALDDSGSDLADQIAAVQSDVADNARDIASNLEAIRANESAIADNAAAIEANAGAIEANAAAIEVNAAAIADNATAIADNATAIAANRASIDVIYDESTGMINSSVLPSFVDDVIEGTVCLSNDSNDPTYTVTHSSDTIIGFFRIAKEGETDADKLTLVISGDPESVDLSGSQFEHAGSTYTFKPVSAKTDPETSAIYVDVQTNRSYRWSGSQFVVVASNLAIGTTSSSAFAGSRGVALEEKAVELEAKTDELEAKADELEGKLDAAVVAFQNSDASHDAAIVSLQNAIAASTGDIEAEIAAVRSEAAEAHQNFNASAAAAHQAIEDEIDELRQSAAAEHSALDAKIGTAVSTLQQSVAAHESAIVTLQQQIADTEGAVQTMTLDDILANSTVDSQTGLLNVSEIWFDCGNSRLAGEEESNGNENSGNENNG